MPTGAFRRDWVPPIAIALMLAISAATYPFLPDVITVHWDLALRPDGFAGKPVAVLVLPLISLGLVAMQFVGRRVATAGTAPLRFGPAVIFVAPLLLAAHCLIVGVALIGRPPG